MLQFFVYFLMTFFPLTTSSLTDLSLIKNDVEPNSPFLINIDDKDTLNQEFSTIPNISPNSLNSGLSTTELFDPPASNSFAPSNPGSSDLLALDTSELLALDSSDILLVDPFDLLAANPSDLLAGPFECTSTVGKLRQRGESVCYGDDYPEKIGINAPHIEKVNKYWCSETSVAGFGNIPVCCLSPPMGDFPLVFVHVTECVLSKFFLTVSDVLEYLCQKHD